MRSTNRQRRHAHVVAGIHVDAAPVDVELDRWLGRGLELERAMRDLLASGRRRGALGTAGDADRESREHDLLKPP